MQSYNMVLQNINVTHPCQSSGAAPSSQELAPVQPFDRAQEMNRMGVFELEEGFDTLKVSFAQPIEKMSVNDLGDLTAQLDQVLKANNIERRQHDFSGGNKPSGGAPGGQGHP